MFIFECLPLFLLSLFWPHLVSISLSLSLSFSFLSSFLLVFFLLSLGSWFLYLSFFLFLLCFCFMKRTTSKYSITKCLFINPFHFCWFPLFLFLSNPLSLSLLFPDFKFCFLFNINVFSQNMQVKNTNFRSRGGLQHSGFLLTCALQNVKSYRFFASFCQVFLIFKPHCKMGI